MSFPYLDLYGFKLRTVMAAAEVDYVETDTPGYTAGRIAVRSSYINGRLRKRYGATATTNSLPLGQTAPELIGSGTTPPGLSLRGQPILGSMQVIVSITTGGATGTAVFKWSSNNGITYNTGVTSATSVSLGGTGLSVLFPSTGTFSTDNVYAAATPVPEIVLGWLTTLVTYDLYRKRGVNPQDPQIELLVVEMTNVLAEIKEAADSRDGLFDLPVSEDEDSAVTTGGPLGTSQTSPYVWTDVERAVGEFQDAEFRGGNNF